MGNFSEQIKRNEENYNNDYFDPENVRNQLNKKAEKKEFNKWLLIRIVTFLCFIGYLLYQFNQILF